MKDIDKKDAPDVPGGFAIGDNGCIPSLPLAGDYPPGPFGPRSDPQPNPVDPGLSTPAT